MEYPATARRTGALLEMLGYTAGIELKRVLDGYRETIVRDSPFANISLLPGVPYVNLNERWLGKMP